MSNPFDKFFEDAEHNPAYHRELAALAKERKMSEAEQTGLSEYLLSRPSTTSRKRGIHLMKNALTSRLMAAMEDGKMWGGRRWVKLNGGKTIAATKANLAAVRRLNKEVVCGKPI